MDLQETIKEAERICQGLQPKPKPKPVEDDVIEAEYKEAN